VSQTTAPPRPSQDQGSPPVDPRFRRRWAEARRAEGRRRLRILLTAMSLVVVAVGGVGLLHSPAFDVREVVVVGNAHTSPGQVLVAAGLSPSDRATLMVDVGSPNARRAVEALPWVGTVSFRRRWPWTVVVTVKERLPVAVVTERGVTDIVDETGRVLEVIPPRDRVQAHQRDAVLPVVDDAQGTRPGGRVSPTSGTTGPQLAELLAAAAAAPRALAERRLQLSYSSNLGLVARVGAADAVVLLGSSTQIGQKLAVLEELLTSVQLGGYSQVDLTVWQRPALTPLPNSVNS
jgi:cell division septal protein FtsQ